MSSPLENVPGATTKTETLPTTRAELIYWPKLQTAEQAFVAAYVENAYSLPEACRALKISQGAGAGMLRKVTIRRAIGEVQHELDGIDFLNEKWVKAQLLRLYPMVLGDEPVPYITASGEEAEGRKFDAGAAMRIIEYVAPKAQKSTLSITVNNINKLSDEQLEELAAKGMGRVVSEQ